MKCAQFWLVRRGVTLTCRCPESRLTSQKQLAHPFGFKRVINPLRLAWLQRQALSFVPEELFGTFVHANLWKTWIVGTGIHLQDIFHAPHKGRTRLRGDTPALFQPRLEFGFFSTLRTVSWLTCSA